MRSTASEGCVDETRFVCELEKRVREATYDEWPVARPPAEHSLHDAYALLGALRWSEVAPGAAVKVLAERANEALWSYSEAVSEDAQEPFGGEVFAEGGVFEVRFGRLPRGTPDARGLARRLDPIRVSLVVSTERP